MDIDSMSAGSEMDALVAEKVMGYRVDRPETTGLDDWWEVIPCDELGTIGRPLWGYSTDMVAAWRVVEKLLDRFSTLHFWSGSWQATFDTGDTQVYNSHPCCSPALAICRAALKAVMK